MTDKFVFSSGVGAWSTELQIKPDGSFTGEYIDWNAGTGSDLPYYYSEETRSVFHGTFVNPKKINDKIYSFELGSLVYDSPTSGEEIDEEQYLRIKYSPAYGLINAKSFYYYRGGFSYNELPEMYVHWMEAGLRKEDMDNKWIPIPGIYNINEQYAFFQWKG